MQANNIYNTPSTPGKNQSHEIFMKIDSIGRKSKLNVIKKDK